MTWKLLAMTLSKSLKNGSYLESWMEGRVLDQASGFNLDFRFQGNGLLVYQMHMYWKMIRCYE